MFLRLRTQKMPNQEHCPGVCVYVFSLELFSRPVLEVSPSHPVEGHSVTLTCKTQVITQSPPIEPRFCFKDIKVLGSGCSSSPKLQIRPIWRKDPEPYWCSVEVTTPSIKKWSQATYIHVQSEYLSLLFQCQGLVRQEQDRMSPMLLPEKVDTGRNYQLPW